MAQDEADGVEEKFVRVCKGLNNGVEARIVTEGGQLRWFWIERGLRQGCPSLPTLFNLYVSGMVDEFKRARMGVKIDDEWCGTLLYVNDIVLWLTQEWCFKTCWRWCRIMWLSG